MEIIILWIGTVIASFVMEMANESRMFKDVADNGYKMDINRISEFAKQMNPNTSNATMKSLLVPGVNIAGVLKRTIMYNNARSTILDQLNVIDCLMPMTEKEEEEYKQNPTTMNALLLHFKPLTVSKEEPSKLDNDVKNGILEANFDISNASYKIEFLDNDDISTIWFKFDENKIKIVETDGPIDGLSDSKQLIKLEQKLEELGIDLNSKDLIDKTPKENNLPNQVSIQEKLEQLLELRNSISTQKTEENNKQEVDSFQKIKK